MGEIQYSWKARDGEVGVSLAEIARHLGVSISAVSQIFRRREKSALTLSTPSPKLSSILGLGTKKTRGYRTFRNLVTLCLSHRGVVC